MKTSLSAFLYTEGVDFELKVTKQEIEKLVPDDVMR